MPIGEGKVIEPTGQPYKINMATFGHWTKAGVMDKEYLFCKDSDCMDLSAVLPCHYRYIAPVDVAGSVGGGS